ncbi:MAG: hypothetical protein HFJ41_02105 [Clostridia bacterium]|nr:hypothetical protein [Clostridia bacterium]
MNRYIKIKSKVLIRIIASLLMLIITLQLFPAIVFGIQNEIENNRESNIMKNDIQSINNIEQSNQQINSTEENNQEGNNIANYNQEINNTKENNNVDKNNQTNNNIEENIIEKQENIDNNNLKDDSKIIGEIIEKRTLNQKHFLQEDGNVITNIYPSSIHYEKDGKLVDINNSLEESNENGGEYKNKENSFQVKFSKKSNKNDLVKLQIKNHNIKWSLQNSNKVEAKKFNNDNEKEEKFKLKNISSGTVQYENILNGIDLEYNVISNEIKENIVYKDKTAIEQQIVFEFNTDNLEMEKTEDGRIIFTEKNSEEVFFFFDIPYMYDAKNETSEDIELKLEEKNGNKYKLTVIPNKEWLEDEEREYPVVIDPTVKTSLNYENIQDTYIFNGDTGYPNRHEAHILRVGSNRTLASKNPTRSLIKFGLPNLSAGDQVISATLDICSYIDTNEWTPPTEIIQIDVHKMTTDWTAPTATWNNLNDKYDTRISDYAKYQYDTNQPAKFYYFDITSMVKDWYITGNNYGLVLKDHTEVYNAPHSDAYFFSADINRQYINARPMVQIVYRNQTGLETYQTYHTQQVGRAGTIHTNDYNGNVTLLHPDASTPGQNLSVSVNHVYNTNDKEVNIGYGNGFRLNLSQTIEKVTIGEQEYAKYTDEDGTKHYFDKSGNSYIDSENLKLTLKLENDIFTLIDNSNNKFIFTKKASSSGEIWHLSKSIDANNNTINITLLNDSTVGARIEKVTDSAGDSINFTYTNNKLTTITDKTSRSTNYEYDNNGNLVKITYSDAKYSEYTYSNKLLTSVKNIDNSHINYEYYNEKSNRLKSIKEYGTNNALGNTISISYGDNVTKFTDNTGYSNTYTFNNFGQTISISDFGKNPNDIDNAYGKMYQYGEEQKNKNRLTLDGNLISIAEKENNLIKNGNFSNGLTNWGKTNCDDNDKVENGSFKFIGNSNIDKNIYQNINISGKKGDIFTLATWVNSKAVPNNKERAIKVSLTIHFIRQDGTRQSINKNVNVDGSGWQFKSEVVIADNDYTNAIVYLVCTYNENETYFDNVGLFKEEFGQSYTYDDNGNIVSTEELAEGQKNYEYMNNKMITKIDSNGTKYSYEYDYLNPTKLLGAKNSLGNKYNFKYDEKGNLTSTLLMDNTLISNDMEDWGSYYFRFANSEKVLNKTTDSSGNDKLNLEYFNGTNNQMFLIREDFPLGQYKIYADYSSKAIEAISKEIVSIEQGYNSNTQCWKFIKQDDGSYKITNVEQGDDYCLTLDDNNNIKLLKDEGKLSQRIYAYSYMTETKSKVFNNLVLESNEIYRIKAKNSKMYLQAVENGNLVQNTYEKENVNQLWRVVNVYDGIYKIVNLSSAQGASMYATTTGITLNLDNEPPRDLRIERNGNNTFKIKSDFCMQFDEPNQIFTVENNSSNAQAKIILNTNNDNGSQDFIFEKANLLNVDENHYYKIKAKCSNLYLGVSSNNTIQQQESNDSSEQKWRFKDNGNGTYQIISATNNTNTMQIENYENPTASIKLGENGVNDGFEIIARIDGTYCIKPGLYSEYFAFDISNASTQAGTEVALYTSNDSIAQKFYIEETGIYENGQIGKYIQTTAEYSENGKYQTKSIGENDNTANYTYNNNTGTIVAEETDYNKFEYTYDNLDRMTKVELKDNGQVISKNEYTYESDKLKTIKAGENTYEFIYDEFGNTKQVKIGSEVLVTNNYEENNGNLLSEVFANRQTLSYAYDRFNRITKKEGENGSYTYTYNADSNIKTIVDEINNNTKSFTYDLAQRLVKEINSNGFTKEYGYDINSNINNKKYILNNQEKNTKYNFDNYNRLNSIVDSNSVWKRQTDSLSRINKNIISNEMGEYKTNYEYLNVQGKDNKTTTYISKVTNGDSTPIEYEYYSNGNIKAIKKGNNITSYQYNSANELIRENNSELNKTVVYTYDSNGNILNKKEYEYTTDESLANKTITNTITYEYENQNYKDQLTSYNGRLITYDEIGNPTWYDEKELIWQNGRQLRDFNDWDNKQSITYKYNENGIRTQKTVNGYEVTNYYLDGTNVIYEKTGNNIICYTYDSNDNILGLNYNGIQYYYIKNAQNDVIGILDSNLNQIVSYVYDSWGKIISIKDANGNNITDETNIGIINPYRYRSYRYDTETGLYYLQSRYYNPEWGRFLNVDGLLQTGDGILDKNMYAYCLNNPIKYLDKEGEAVLISTIFVVCAVISGIATYATIVHEDKKAGYETNHVDAIARSIVNAGAIYSVGAIAEGVGNSISTYTNTKKLISNKSKSTAFVPEEYWTRNAPRIGTPNTNIEYLKLNLYTNKIEKSNVIYDFAGRQIFRVDYTNHGRIDHTKPHLHTIRWDFIYLNGKEDRFNLK